MGIQRSTTFIHWNFFLALEEDLERISRYVDLGGNDSTYSIEIGRLLLSASAECDVVLKQLVRQLDPSSTADKFGHYREPVVQHLPRFLQFEATLPRFGITLTPWVDWTDAHAPYWWSDHNKVKHQRDEHFERATLKNCLNAMAGLYCSTLHLYCEAAEPGRLPGNPRLLAAGATHGSGTVLHPGGVSFTYRALAPEPTT